MDRRPFSENKKYSNFEKSPQSPPPTKINMNYPYNSHNLLDLSRIPFSSLSLNGSCSAPLNFCHPNLTPPGSEKSFPNPFSTKLSFNPPDRRQEVRTPTPSHTSSQGHRFSLLPSAALDENNDIRSDWTIQTVVDEKLLMCFAMDKAGCHFLQNNFYGPDSPNQFDEYLRSRIFEDVLSGPDSFYVLSTNIFGNFFVQRIIEQSRSQEQDIIRRYFSARIMDYCLDKSGCRVVQTALEKMRPKIVDQLVESFPRDGRLMALCTDQNANHVIQKVIKKMPLEKWEFIVSFLCIPDHLVAVSQDKYGCRVVQTVIEVLTNGEPDDFEKMHVLRRIMGKILVECKRLTSNEFANYVIQHIIETPGVLGEYRDAIIEKCLLRSLLSMSQEKYASHVVERAFTFAPLPILAEMMDEIFDGYMPHPETGKDALDILIFHQFGNYVIQRMLQICCASVLRRRTTTINGVDCHYKFQGWLNKLTQRAKREKSRLTRFSSGKKILDILETMKSPYDLDRRPRYQHPNADFFYQQLASTSGAFFTPSTSSVTSEDVEHQHHHHHHQKPSGDYFHKF